MNINKVLIGLSLVVTICLVLIITSCGDEKGLQNTAEEVGFRFGMWNDTTGDEDFIAVTTDEEIITLARQQLMLPVPERTFHIHGVVTYGNGGHNLNWSWHFLPSEWELVEASIEVCDTNPFYVRTWLDSMPDTISSILICPLSSYVKTETR